MRAQSCGRCGIWEPCWPIPEPKDCLPCVDVHGHDAGQWRDAWQTAATEVYDATCQRWPGDCWVEIVRPCLPPCGCRGGCTRCGWRALDLSAAFCLPLRQIRSIIVNGREWEGAYRVESVAAGHICQPGGACGPFLTLEGCTNFPSQNLSAPLGADCTWAIVADVGCPPPDHIYRQTAKYAAELIKADCDPDNCALPDGVTRMTRKGMSVEFDTERTGLKVLDDAIKRWKCEPVDFEASADLTPEVTFHRQWIGSADDLGGVLAGLLNG